MVIYGNSGKRSSEQNERRWEPLASRVAGNASVPPSRAQLWSLAARSAGYSAKLLATQAKTTLRYIERRCLKDLGRTPQEWFNEQRMVAARCLLLETKSVKHASMETGFKQVSHFCRHFKLHYRITPTEFLRIHGKLNQKSGV